MVCILLSANFDSALSAIDPTPPPQHDWVKIEGPQIDHDSWLVLGAMANSPLASSRENALDGIDQAIRNGESGPSDPNVVSLLASVCLTPLITLSAPGTPGQTDLPILRIRAIQLTSQLGGDQAHDLLVQLLEIEQEPAVLVEAHAGLRRMMFEPSEREIALIVRHLRANFSNGAQDALLLELLRDIQDYQQRWNSLARIDIFDGLMALSQDTRSMQLVRTKAQELIKLLLGLR